MSIRNIFTVAALLSVVTIAGCASVPMASDEQDSKAKKFAVPAGKSNIYIYRNESFGGAKKMSVLVDGKMVGDTVSKSYIYLTVNPGKHTVTSRAENESVLNVTTQANKNYFIWQEVKMGGWSARSLLQLVDDATGKKGVGESKLIQIMK
jgi:hypothetical protein